ncbi:MAG: hypothetical protein U9R66_03295 [Thermodesulfobacteriota bacterium]|nr:hypothetical protein [Thermodesulfobacteriota bacterium]
MASDISLDRLTDEIRNVYQDDPDNGADRVEKYLGAALADCSPDRRSVFLTELVSVFSQNSHVSVPIVETKSEAFNRLITMLLGKEILKKNLSLEEMIDQLASALNTVFDSVNKLVGGMNATLMGSTSGEETIRVVISASMDKDEGIQALEKFLDQIGKFFAIALQAYKESAKTKIDEILRELNPENLAEDTDLSLKFGPMRKAYLYDCFHDKYQTLQNWQRSGLLLEAFVKEFEKNCQNLYLKRG